MTEDQTILIGTNLEGENIFLHSSLANRHGLIAGATGTGKTVSLQLLAENFSRLGVPVFTADIKGDLSGLSQPIVTNQKVLERIEKIGIEGFEAEKSPVCLWDLYGINGLPIRTTISEFGPLLLSRILDLNDTQEGVLQIAYKIADDQGLLLLDIKDLQAVLTWMSENSSDIQSQYGNVSKASIAAIQRDLLVLNQVGASNFFGEPALNIDHLMQRDFSGRGVISILDATKLIENPRLYSVFLLWLLSELFENLPE
ncbi:MAG: DUF853 family protein, partial [Bdellovibrionales bacterium]|nr:DUF853 family protein [Bdellovibrionales bacterium]